MGIETGYPDLFHKQRRLQARVHLWIVSSGLSPGKNRQRSESDALPHAFSRSLHPPATTFPPCLTHLAALMLDWWERG